MIMNGSLMIGKKTIIGIRNISFLLFLKKNQGYQPLPHKGKRNFFRLVIASQPPPTQEDMEYVIQVRELPKFHTIND